MAQDRDMDSLIIERVTYPKYLSKQIQPSDILIDRQTYQLIVRDLDKLDNFSSKFAALERENDSLFNALQQQISQLDRLYSQADLLQDKILQNQIELIRTEEELKTYQARYNDFSKAVGEDTRIKYRTRFIFRDKQEKKWFYITWGIFITIPTAVILWQLN
jgi:chromosome segregation ATPase